jgi:hypothetical protein
VLAAIEKHRSSWQIWHVRAEAQRQVRAADVTSDKVDQLVDLLVAEVITRSIPLIPPDDAIVEPVPLRRADGSSVYTVAGSELFTSSRILQAERRLVAAAGRMGTSSTDLPSTLRCWRRRRTGWPWIQGRRAGPIHGQLRCPAAARDRPSRCRQDNGTTDPHTRGWRAAATYLG